MRHRDPNIWSRPARDDENAIQQTAQTHGFPLRASGAWLEELLRNSPSSNGNGSALPGERASSNGNSCN